MPTEYATIVSTVEEVDEKLAAAALEGFMLHSFQVLPSSAGLMMVCVMEKTPTAPGTVELPEPAVKKILGMRCS